MGYGADQVAIWRRSFSTPPPPMEADHEHHSTIRNDPRYADLKAEDFPSCESLELTIKRTMPFWNDTIVPKLREGKTVGCGARQLAPRYCLPPRSDDRGSDH